MTQIDRAPREDGFEYEGRFYRWHVSDLGKDMMLIDRVCGLSLPDFFEALDDPVERGRAPILLSMVATSIRYAHPQWSVERIVRLITEMNLGAIVFVNSDDDAEDEEVVDRPPPLAAGDVVPISNGERSKSAPSASSSSSTPAEPSAYETSFGTPV